MDSTPIGAPVTSYWRVLGSRMFLPVQRLPMAMFVSMILLLTIASQLGIWYEQQRQTRSIFDNQAQIQNLLNKQYELSSKMNEIIRTNAEAEAERRDLLKIARETGTVSPGMTSGDEPVSFWLKKMDETVRRDVRAELERVRLRTEPR